MLVEKHFSSYSLSRAEYELLVSDATTRKIKSVLEFGPGVSTFAFLKAGATNILSLEYSPEWTRKYQKTFNNKANVVLFSNKPYLNIPEANDRTFDAAFVDTPTGGMFRKFSRINSLLYASYRTSVIYVHDAERPAETRSIAVLQELGWKVRRLQGTRRLVVLEKYESKYKVLPREERH